VSSQPVLAAAVDALRAGELVAFPTETVYGLGADAANAAAVRRLFAVKERPADHPVIVHLARTRQLDELGRAVSDAAHHLADAFWPGPLTIVVQRDPARVADAVTGGRATVGLRVPDHPLALELLDAFGGGVAAPGARPSHYAPRVAVEVIEAADVVARSRALLAAGTRGGLLALAGVVPEDLYGLVVLDAPRDVDEFARVLYDRFRAADACELDVLLVVNPPDTDGLGAAIADRVWRASH